MLAFKLINHHCQYTNHGMSLAEPDLYLLCLLLQSSVYHEQAAVVFLEQLRPSLDQVLAPYRTKTSKPSLEASRKSPSAAMPSVGSTPAYVCASQVS